MSDRALSVLVHGVPKVGKTTFATSAPAPRLILDVEAASRFLLHLNKIFWDPMTQAPPVYDGTWDTCIVNVNDFETAIKAYEWLKSGKHPFRSVILDSISELQAKCQEGIVGRTKMQTQDWGTLLQRMAFFCRDMRDLTRHPTTPIEAVVITAMSRDQDGRVKPYLQGQIGSQISYWFDICGYLFLQNVQDEAGNWVEARRLLIGSHDTYEAGSRVPGLGSVLESPNIDNIITSVFGERPKPAELATAPAS